MIQTLYEIKVILREALPELKHKYPIESLAVFGSYSRNEASEESDIDILVELNGPIGLKFFVLADDLEKILGKKVDLVSKNGLNKPWWREHVLQQAKYV